MRLTVVITLLVGAGVLVLVQGDVQQLVRTAIEEATAEYDEKMRLAMIHGAQSNRRLREIPKSTEYSRQVGRISSINRSAFKNLTTKYGIDPEVALTHLRDALPQQCQLQEVTCDATVKYRSLDGKCNNLEHSLWGSKDMPNTRILSPAYTENDEPRGGRDGGNLPNPRILSRAMHQGDDEIYDTTVTHMVAQFGQFLDHDITFTPVEGYACCGNQAVHEDCWKIDVHPSDAHFSKKGVTCLDFVRSTSACFPNTVSQNQQREQMNGITAYIDASMLYGSDDETMNKLRARDGRKGQLMENSEHPGFLPWRSEVDPNGSPTTVFAGDVRANEMPGLTVMHALFLREHNRIAKIFQELTTWDDEKIFQETRRIVAAEVQQITYDQFLPAILGDAAMSDWNLRLPSTTVNNGYTQYNSTTDATILSNFATAAYRFGHTLVNGLIKLISKAGNEVGSYTVRENYLRSNRVLESVNGESGYDLILKGLITQVSQAYDGILHNDLANDLFMNVTSEIGTDLVARNIQRGRDHGTPSYNSFRSRICQIPALTTWDARPDDFTPAAWEALRKHYESPSDIDLYTGGLMQSKVDGALAGRTFICLQGIQFERLMAGDRFFFTHQNQSGSFSPAQLAALRKRTLGDIICDNSVIESTQPNVFRTSGPVENRPVLCSNTNRALDISLFTVDTPAGGNGDAAALVVSFVALLFSLMTILF